MTKLIPALEKNPHLDWICFDLDDTLWETDPVIVKANQAMFDHLHQHVPGAREALQADDWFPLRDEVLAAEPALASSVTALRLKVLEVALQRLGHGGATLEQWQHSAFAVFRHWRNQVTLFDSVISVLQALQQAGYRLGVFSNGNADLRAIGLGEYFEVILSADEVGCAKPDEAAFTALASACGVQAARMAYVGDHPRYDVLGANQAGMVSVWANYQRKAWMADWAPASLELNELSALPRQLARWTPEAR